MAPAVFLPLCLLQPLPACLPACTPACLQLTDDVLDLLEWYADPKKRKKSSAVEKSVFLRKQYQVGCTGEGWLVCSFVAICKLKAAVVYCSKEAEVDAQKAKG